MRDLDGIQIQTTSECNGRCTICCYQSSWHAKNPGIMTEELFFTIIEQIKSIRTRRICPYLENEPLMDKKIFERMEIIRDTCTYECIEFSTNGLLLTGERSERLLDILAGVPHEIWISFHGVDKPTYEQVMQMPFDVAYRNVIDFLKLCEKKNPQARVIIRGAGLPKVKRWGGKRFFGKKQYEQFWEDTLARQAITFRPQIQFFLYHDRAGNLTDPALTFRKSPRRDLKSINCPRVERWLHFLYNGDMVLCCMDYHRTTAFGNIQNNTLHEILQGESYRTLRGQAYGQIPAPDDFICRKCFSPGG